MPDIGDIYENSDAPLQVQEMEGSYQCGVCFHTNEIGFYIPEKRRMQIHCTECETITEVVINLG